MSNQIDVGWSAPPFGLDQLDRKEIRIIATGNDASAFKGQTVRLNIANNQTMQSRRAVVDRYMKAYREALDYMYSSPDVLKVYADFVGISIEKATRSREFFPKESLNPDRIVGLDTIVKDAVTLKYTATEVTKEQLAELISDTTALMQLRRRARCCNVRG